MGRAFYLDPFTQLATGLVAYILAAILLYTLPAFQSGEDARQSPAALIVLCIAGLLLYGSLAVSRSDALKELPGPKYSWLGCIELLRRPDPHRWLAEIVNKYGPVVKIRIITFHYVEFERILGPIVPPLKLVLKKSYRLSKAVVITDPALAVHILNSPHLDKFSFMYSFLDALLGGPSILTGPTDNHWKYVRKAVAPAFSTGHMRDATQLVVEKSDQLVKYLLQEGSSVPQNMDKLLLRESMDVIGRFGFAKDMGALNTLNTPPEQFENGLSDVDVLLGATKEIEDRMGGPHRAFQWWKRELWHGAYLLSRYQRQVNGLLKHIKKKTQRKDSFAELLLRAKHYKTGMPLSDKEMTPEIAALFFAGIDTTGHTGTWLLFLLTQHPEVEAKIVAELDQLELLVTPARPKPRQLTHADLGKLIYLQAVVKEVLRMYPPVGIGQLREARVDIVIADRLKIPKGCLVWVPHYALQTAPFNWKNADKFDPERWFEPGLEFSSISDLPLSHDWYKDLGLDAFSNEALSKVQSINSNARRPKRYFPFAEGPRNCVGQSLAKVSLVTTAATLLSKLSFSLADQMGGPEGVRKREEYKLVTGIKDGMWMHATPRLQSPAANTSLS